MKVNELCQEKEFKIIHMGNQIDREIGFPFCCDLLSVAMAKMPENSAWVTVMGNINTLAVATLADASCVILAEGASLDEVAKNKAVEQGITVYQTGLPIFEAALRIYQKIYG